MVVTIAGGVRVCVPDSVNHLTPYVLLEQEDWFEDETAFVRSFLLPGMRALDVGANHGAYALQAARCVGPTGRVWAFEPAPGPAAMLRASLEENGFEHVTLVEAALADRDDEGAQVRSLDGCADSLGLTDLDLVKLDAEGAEQQILAAGDAVFMLQSPLVLFELVHGEHLDLDLVDRFVELGYRIYRLAPGPRLLVPFSRSTDGYQLNLFACKPDRALQLEDRGLLAAVPGGAERAAVWRKHMATLPYGRRLEARWQACQEDEAWEAYALALNRAIIAHDPNALPAARALHLAAARTGLGALCVKSGTLARRMTLARVAWALGHRQHALEVLTELATELEGDDVQLDEPFLAPCPRFDQVDPGERVADWCRAAVLEQTERLAHFSSYFTVTQALPRLDRLAELGFPCAEMERRRQLIRLRTGEAGPAPALLLEDGPDHHNAAFFAGEGFTPSAPGRG